MVSMTNIPELLLSFPFASSSHSMISSIRLLAAAVGEYREGGAGESRPITAPVAARGGKGWYDERAGRCVECREAEEAWEGDEEEEEEVKSVFALGTMELLMARRAEGMQQTTIPAAISTILEVAQGQQRLVREAAEGAGDTYAKSQLGRMFHAQKLPCSRETLIR